MWHRGKWGAIAALAALCLTPALATQCQIECSHAIAITVIEHTHIIVSAIHMFGLRAGMILGEDFFLSNHVLISSRRRRLYFTCNGGPIFAIGHRYLIQRDSAAPVAVNPGLKPQAGGLPSRPGAGAPARSCGATWRSCPTVSTVERWRT
jgi:hypothetical protein